MQEGRRKEGQEGRVLEAAYPWKCSTVDADGGDSYYIAVICISEPYLPLFCRSKARHVWFFLLVS